MSDRSGDSLLARFGKPCTVGRSDQYEISWVRTAPIITDYFLSTSGNSPTRAPSGSDSDS